MSPTERIVLRAVTVAWQSDRQITRTIGPRAHVATIRPILSSLVTAGQVETDGQGNYRIPITL